MENTTLQLMAGLGMVAVGVIATVFWRSKTALAYRWFWIGAGLWTVAVVLKVSFSLLVGKSVMAFLTEHLSPTLRVLAGGLYFGIQSAFFEMGLTLLAVLVWRKLGNDSARAIGVGLGAGAFEATILGLMTVAGMLAFMAGLPGTQGIASAIDAQAEKTPVFWLLPPAERLLTLIIHGSSRALILLGVAKRQTWLVVFGFVLFTGLDGAVVSCQMAFGEHVSMWWIEIVPLVFAVFSLPILFWCQSKWRETASSPLP